MATIRQLKLNEIKKIDEHYIKQDFPKRERRSFFNIALYYKSKRYFCYGYFENDRMLAYACLIFLKDRDYALLDYFAVIKELRDHGIGSKFLKILMSELPINKGIFIENENPDFAKSKKKKEKRYRRINFYLENGAVLTNSKYLLFGVNYNILFLPQNDIKIEEEDFPDIISKMYKEIYSLLYFIFCKSC